MIENPKLQDIGPFENGVIPAIPSFSFLGCGVNMRFYSRVTSDVYETTQWVTLFGLPLIPLSTWLISPVAYDINKTARELSTKRFMVHGRRPYSAARIGRMYLTALSALVVCLGPLVAAFCIVPKPAGGKDSPLGILFLVAAVWAFIAKIFIVDRRAVDPYDELREEATRRQFSRSCNYSTGVLFTSACCATCPHMAGRTNTGP